MGVGICSEELAGKVVAGVDTHADTHWLCVLDEERRVALSREFPADAAGIAALAVGVIVAWFRGSLIQVAAACCAVVFALELFL